MKKVSTTYLETKPRTGFFLTVNEEPNYQHISVHDEGEPCSGVLRHWGKPEDLVEELEAIIRMIKEFAKNEGSDKCPRRQIHASGEK